MAIVVDPQDVADLITLSSLYAFLVAASDLAGLTHYTAVRADLDALARRVDRHVTELGDRMGMSAQDDGDGCAG